MKLMKSRLEQRFANRWCSPICGEALLYCWDHVWRDEPMILYGLGIRKDDAIPCFPWGWGMDQCWEITTNVLLIDTIVECVGWIMVNAPYARRIKVSGNKTDSLVFSILMVGEDFLMLHAPPQEVQKNLSILGILNHSSLDEFQKQTPFPFILP